MCSLNRGPGQLRSGTALLLLSLVVVSAQPQRWFMQLPPSSFYTPDVDVTSPTPLPRVPPSPYHMGVDNCPQQNGVPYAVGGFPGTPYLQTPFQTFYRQPTHLQPSTTVCRTGDITPQHCMQGYQVDISAITARPWDTTIPACQAFPPTNFLAYNGEVPGPTIHGPV